MERQAQAFVICLERALRGAHPPVPAHHAAVVNQVERCAEQNTDRHHRRFHADVP